MAHISYRLNLQVLFLLCFFTSFPLFAAGARHARGLSSQKDNPGQRLWCIAKPSAFDNNLLANINFACSQSGVDCSVLQNGNPCYYPNTPVSHAAVAMNLYFQHYGRNYWNCYFNNTGLVVLTDPSFGICQYISQDEWETVPKTLRMIYIQHLQ